MAHDPGGAGDAGDGEWPGRIAVIGGGTMGLGFAEQFALARIPVRLVDATPDLTARAMANLHARVAGHVAAGIVPGDAINRLVFVQAVANIADAVAGADFVLEAAPETRAIKRQVLGACAAGVADAPDASNVVIASNTSSFPIDDLAAFVTAPARFLGMHWFNPPEWTPGVEVIPHAGTDPAVTARVTAFLRRLGKRPVVVGSGPGFVANRIQNALFLEAVACVADGLASPEEVDEIVRASFGFRLPFYGPFQIADMAGLDTYASVLETLHDGLGERFYVPERLRAAVDAGRLGTKTGAGFADYAPDARDRLLTERDRRYAALTRLLAELDSTENETAQDAPKPKGEPA